MSCRVCGSRDVELFLDLGDQPHCNRLIPPEMADRREPFFPLRTGFCRACTLVQIDHTIPKEDMFSDYPYVSGTTRTLVAHFAETSARLVERYGLSETDLVVDIGSNDGTWLKQYRPFGLRVLGVEPAANVVALARAAGVPTENAFFNKETAERVLAEHGQASLMTAAGVFFHLEELHSVVEGIKVLLKEDGVFCVQAIYLGGMIENTAFDQIYHEHLCYYTLRSLEELFRRHGLEVFDVSVVPIHGGSLEAHVGWAGRRPASDAVHALRAEEERRGYGRIETYQAFAENVWRLKRDLLDVLEAARRDGKTVYCYGAPAKGATLLNSFGIDTRLVQLATEKSPLKFGKMIPGARIPIVDEATVPPPDAYLVLAWNFLDEFLGKERRFLEGGGQFIVPVPRLRVVTAADLPATVRETAAARL
ncbi:MAG: class I SAM-dependent methyltransferase [Methylobacteriaceae bacterium]|nr:class I SAM-dependent methyltransferase [Methylobacteriaceae bacterium]